MAINLLLGPCLLGAVQLALGWYATQLWQANGAIRARDGRAADDRWTRPIVDASGADHVHSRHTEAAAARDFARRAFVNEWCGWSGPIQLPVAPACWMWLWHHGGPAARILSRGYAFEVLKSVQPSPDARAKASSPRRPALPFRR